MRRRLVWVCMNRRLLRFADREYANFMSSSLRRRLTISCIVVLMVSALLSLGHFLPHRTIQIRSSSTTEWHLLLSAGSVGLVKVTDASGFAIPYFSRAPEVVDLKTWRQTKSGGIWMLWRSGDVVVTNRHGGPVTIQYRVAVYLLLPALAVLILVLLGVAKCCSLLSLRFHRWKASRVTLRQICFGESCPKCGYDVRTNENICPECGQHFRRASVIVAVTESADHSATIN